LPKCRVQWFVKSSLGGWKGIVSTLIAYLIWLSSLRNCNGIIPHSFCKNAAEVPLNVPHIIANALFCTVSSLAFRVMFALSYATAA